MYNQNLPQVLFIVKKYGVFKAIRSREYCLLGVFKYNSATNEFDILESDIGDTAFVSELEAWESLRDKVDSLTQWVNMNLSHCKNPA